MAACTADPTLRKIAARFPGLPFAPRDTARFVPTRKSVLKPLRALQQGGFGRSEPMFTRTGAGGESR